MLQRRWPLAIWFLFLARAFFYCAALPLWEGYDEWSHFAVVERMAFRGEPLVSRDAPVGADIAASLEPAPVPRSSDPLFGKATTSGLTSPSSSAWPSAANRWSRAMRRWARTSPPRSKPRRCPALPIPSLGRLRRVVSLRRRRAHGLPRRTAGLARCAGGRGHRRLARNRAGAPLFRSPLWEGYDEWSHFAVVERMAFRGEPLVSRDAPVGADIAASLETAPVP